MNKLPISLCVFVKNEERNIKRCLDSVKSVVSEIIIVDTGSTDNTINIAKSYTDLVYNVPFTDFGSIRTLTAHLASMPWILMLDADETLTFNYDELSKLVSTSIGVNENYELDFTGNVVTDSYAIPRRRWADKWLCVQEDIESYPDLQVRLFRNHTNRRKIKFVRRVHETVDNCINTKNLLDSTLVIEHLQNVNKTEQLLIDRRRQYISLNKLDLQQGVDSKDVVVKQEDYCIGKLLK